MDRKARQAKRRPGPLPCTPSTAPTPGADEVVTLFCDHGAVEFDALADVTG